VHVVDVNLFGERVVQKVVLGMVVANKLISQLKYLKKLN
jgi:hypothetical protein